MMNSRFPGHGIGLFSLISFKLGIYEMDMPELGRNSQAAAMGYAKKATPDE